MFLMFFSCMVLPIDLPDKRSYTLVSTLGIYVYTLIALILYPHLC